MVIIPFNEFYQFSDCPIWWQNFTDKALEGVSLFDLKAVNKALDNAIKKYNGIVADSDDCPDLIDHLEFETEEDAEAFKLIWTLYGGE